MSTTREDLALLEAALSYNPHGPEVPLHSEAQALARVAAELERLEQNVNGADIDCVAVMGKVDELERELARLREDEDTLKWTIRRKNTELARFRETEARLRDGLRRIAEGDWPDDFFSYHSNPLLITQDFARALLSAIQATEEMA